MKESVFVSTCVIFVFSMLKLGFYLFFSILGNYCVIFVNFAEFEWGMIEICSVRLVVLSLILELTEFGFQFDIMFWGTRVQSPFVM